MPMLRKAPTLTVVIATPVKGGSPRPKPGEEDLPFDGDEEEDDQEEEQDDEGADDIGSLGTPEEDDNQRIVLEAMRALQGKSRHPEEAINEFLEVFGQDELEALRRMVQEEGTGDESASEPEPEYAARGRLITGPGQGLADRIPAQAGNQRVLLSDGEFVVPADVVSMLGDGSTSAGVRMLEAMMSRVRKSKTGSSKQAKALDRSLLPV